MAQVQQHFGCAMPEGRLVPRFHVMWGPCVDRVGEDDVVPGRGDEILAWGTDVKPGGLGSDAASHGVRIE